jgi:hypothetical protein
VPETPEGRRIAPLPPGFADDDGDADPRLADALASYAVDQSAPGGQVEVCLALQSARLLVPVVAVLGEVAHDAAGLAHDKSSEMATALLTGRDGRRALLVFSSLETLSRWRTDARPVPVAARLAARSAVQEGAEALVLDVAGPVTVTLEGDLLDGLARGWTLTRTPGGHAWVSVAGQGME